MDTLQTAAGAFKGNTLLLIAAELEVQHRYSDVCMPCITDEGVLEVYLSIYLDYRSLLFS